MLPYGKQTIDEDDIQAVVDALRSPFLTTGPLVEEFEQRFAEYVGAKHAIAVANGTAALHLAMLAANIGPGDRVVTSPNTFVASANAAAFVGATPDFCDIDPISYNLCPGCLEAEWKNDTRAVVAVHYAGQTADMPEIARVARQHGALVIEDACHGVGGQFEHDGKNWKVGGHPWADITTFSFHPVKSMTTGEGGMLITDDDQIAAQVRLLRTHGITRDPDMFVGLSDDKQSHQGSDCSPHATRSSPLLESGPWYYEMQSLGYNYRITDFQCALGLSQLSRLPQWIERRRQIVGHYNEAFSGLPNVTIPQLRNPADRDLTSWHLYTLQIDFERCGITRSTWMNELRAKGVGTQVLYIPVHLQPWYRRTYGYIDGKCPVAESYYRRSLSLPLYPSMTEEDVQSVIGAVRELGSASE